MHSTTAAITITQRPANGSVQRQPLCARDQYCADC